MKCLDNVRTEAARLGGCLDEAMAAEGGQIVVDAPSGYVWKANGAPSLNAGGELWGGKRWAAASREILADIRDGIRLATDEEREEIENERDEEWRPA